VIDFIWFGPDNGGSGWSGLLEPDIIVPTALQTRLQPLPNLSNLSGSGVLILAQNQLTKLSVDIFLDYNLC
jgi:hypothetical protein